MTDKKKKQCKLCKKLYSELYSDLDKICYNCIDYMMEDMKERAEDYISE